MAWTAKGLRKLVLPGGSASDRQRRIAEVAPEAVAAPVPGWIARPLRAYFESRGNAAALVRIQLDLPEATPFTRSVYAAMRRIPPSRTRTYGDLAASIGRPAAARAVGTVCRRNPLPLCIPCHRVVPSTGGLGHFTAPGGTSLKRRLLEHEAVSRVGASAPSASGVSGHDRRRETA